MNSPSRRDRHLDPDAAGSPVRLLPELGVRPGTVTIVIAAADAVTWRGQLLAWATVNTLLRCYSVLSTVIVRCPDATLAGRLPQLSGGTVPARLHEALADLAAATADPQGRGPRLEIQPAAALRFDAASGDTVTLVLGTEYADTLARLAGTNLNGVTWLVAAGAWKLSIASPAALAGIDVTQLPSLAEDGPVSAATWLASAVGCAEAFKSIGQLRKGRGRQIESFSVNLWTLTGSDGFAVLGTRDGPSEPPRLPAHYVIGAGAVSQAYLAVLESSDVFTELLLLDDDLLDHTNLNRHILAGWADLGSPKAALARERLPGHRTRIFPVSARWRNYLAIPPTERDARPDTLAAAEADGRYEFVISAVDRNDSRISIAQVSPHVILGGSTNGLAVEVGRYRADSAWQCLACASRPEPQLSIEQAARELAGKTADQLAALARDRGLDLAALTEYLSKPVCGTLGAREVERFAAITRPDWSVSFVSVASGALLAARALTHASGEDTCETQTEGDTLRLWLANATINRTAHRRNPGCPVCGHR